MKRNIDFSRMKRVVVKVGTSVLTDSSGHFSFNDLKNVAAEVNKLL